MYELFEAITNRVRDLSMANSVLTENAYAGDDRVTVASATHFSYEAMNRSFPEILLQDRLSTGRRIGGNYENAQILRVKQVAGNTLIFDSVLQRDYLVSNQAKVKSAPFGIVINQVKIGDIEVLANIPAVCVIPVTKRNSWAYMVGTEENLTMNVICYSEGGDTEEATKVNMKLTDVVEHILMSKLHIMPTNATKTWQSTSRALVSDINYGDITKGSTTFKASRMTFTTDSYIWRGYLTAQGAVETPMSGPIKGEDEEIVP